MIKSLTVSPPHGQDGPCAPTKLVLDEVGLNRYLEKIKKLIPVYSWIPLGSVLLMNFLAYYVNRLFTAGRPHYSMWTPIDDHIPFLSWFSVFYVLAFVQWIIGFILIARESKAVCFRFLSAEFIAKALCLVCFLIIPTTITWPKVEGTSVFDVLTRLIYATDQPDNLFPSIHCLESWICLRSCTYLKKVPSWYRSATRVMTILVFASTVCIKQHVFVDIPGAILVGETGLLLVSRFRVDRVFARIKICCLGEKPE